jgi:repressor lexA
MSGNLSKRQGEILKYIKSCIIKKGYPPSVREIGAAVGLSSSSSVHSNLEALEKKGYIRKSPNKSRTIEVVDEDFSYKKNNTINIPLLGEVAAGQPIFAQENISDYFPVPAQLLPKADAFMLTVHGDSMINAGIYDGDCIIVAKQTSAQDGDIVVVLLEDSATVKTFYKEKEFIRLQPENDTMEPILVKEAVILGKVAGLFRKI